MIRLLQKKFIMTAQAAVSVLLIVLVCAINGANVWLTVRQMDQQLEMRLCQERDSVLEQIKSANRGQGAQAARYYGGMGQQQHPQGFQFGNA